MPVTIGRRAILAAALATPLAAPALRAQAAMTLQVRYPFPGGNNREVHEAIAERFTRENPDIRVAYLAPAQNYEDALQQALRGLLVGQLPDVGYHGLNLLRTLVERRAVAPLSRFVAAEGGLDRLGYAPAIASTIRRDGEIWAAPFFISTPVLYVNDDLVRAAGADPAALPADWGALAALGQRIAAGAAGRTGFYYQWDITGNWMWQALLFSRGGRVLREDERRVAFDGPEGLWTLEQLEAFARAGMPNLRSAQARPAFAAGALGIFADSSSNIAFAEQQVAGRFPLRVLPFPLAHATGRVPAGGALGVVHATDPNRQEAAWRFLRFATGPVGQTIVVEKTGYMPGNLRAIDDPALLGGYYARNPNQKVSVDQLPVMTDWVAYPGANAVRMIEAIRSQLEAVVTGRRTAQAALTEMAAEAQRLLPVA